MRKLILFVFLFLCATQGRSQLQLENSLNSAAGIRVVNFSYFGKKLMGWDYYSMLITFYNLDYTVWKTIQVNVPGYDKLQKVDFPSDKLFHTDTLIEAHITLVTPNNNAIHSYIINENNTILYDNGSNAGNTTLEWLDGQYKLIAHTSFGNYNVYTAFIPLPGYLPCETCVEDTTGMGLKTSNLSANENTFLVADAVPNPSDNSALVRYTLPKDAETGALVFYNGTGQEVRRLTLSKNKQSVEINTKDLPAGMYYFHIYSGGKKSVGNKMIVIH